MDLGCDFFWTVEGSWKAWIYILKFISEKDEFISKSYKPLLSSSLCKLGSVFAVIAHNAKNLLEVKSIVSQALRYSLNSHTSPSNRYTIVNFRRREQRYDQARLFCIFDKN